MAPSGQSGLWPRTSNPVYPQTIGGSIPPQSRHSYLLNNYSQNDKSRKEDLVG